MGLLEQCEAAFGSPDLYRVLGVRREASPEEIRRGYHRASLRVHPDRAEPDAKEEATRRFQVSAGGGPDGLAGLTGAGTGADGGWLGLMGAGWLAGWG